MSTAPAKEELLPHQHLHLNARKGRYGVAYLRAIAGQAGCGFGETPPGEDTLAFDYTLDFPEAGARVQVKTSAQYQIDGDDDYLTFSAKDKWIKKWSRIKVPLYFVIVVVPDDSGSWLTHDTNGTLMVRTAAYWVRLTPATFDKTKTIKVPRSQRVTVGTIPLWHQDLCDLFTPSADKEEAA